MLARTEAAWSQKQVDVGKCGLCGGELLYKQLCEKHLIHKRDRADHGYRQRVGISPEIPQDDEPNDLEIRAIKRGLGL